MHWLVSDRPALVRRKRRKGFVKPAPVEPNLTYRKLGGPGFDTSTVSYVSQLGQNGFACGFFQRSEVRQSDASVSECQLERLYIELRTYETQTSL